MTEAERVADRALGGLEADPVTGTDVDLLPAQVESLRVELVPGDRCRCGRCSRASWERQVDRGWDLVGQLVTGERAGEADRRPLVAERSLDEVRIGIQRGRAEEPATDLLDRPLLVQVPQTANFRPFGIRQTRWTVTSWSQESPKSYS